MSSTGNFDLDHAYLRTTVAAPLTEAMAQLAVLQPDDPVEFLGNYLLKFVANELERQRLQELKREQSHESRATTVSATTPATQQTSNSGDKINSANAMQSELEQERAMLAQLQSESSVADVFQRFVAWLCAAMHAEEAYVGRKCINPAGNALVHWVASSRADSVTLDKFVSEDRGVTFDVFKQVDDPAAPVDADGNALPPAVPAFVHIENVLREPRMQFFHVPKLGAFVAKGLKYHSFLHADVFNDANPESPHMKEDWLVVALDTMGQARAFTPRELDTFQRACALLVQSLEELERTLYMNDVAHKSSHEDGDALLHEFHVAFAAQVAVQEENLALQLQALPEAEKLAKEIELRAAFMTYLLVNHTPTLAMAATRVVPFKPPVLLAFAAALSLLGYAKSMLYNPVTQSPCWTKLAPLLNESALKACLEAFPTANPPTVADAKLALRDVAKADVESGSPIAHCLYLWVQAVIAHRESLDAIAELARQQEADAADNGADE